MKGRRLFVIRAIPQKHEATQVEQMTDRETGDAIPYTDRAAAIMDVATRTRAQPGVAEVLFAIMRRVSGSTY